MGADEVNLDSKWPYFKSLCFLKDIVAPRPSTGNLSAARGFTNSPCPTNGAASSSTGPPGEVNMFTANHPQYLENETDSPVSDRHEFVRDEEGHEENSTEGCMGNSSTHTPTSRKPTRKRARIEDFNASILIIEQQKLEYLIQKRDRRQSSEDDADLYFFKSLLPHVKRIPEERKMSFRSRIQNIVDEFAYPFSRNRELVAYSPSTSIPSSDRSADMSADPFAAAFFKDI